MRKQSSLKILCIFSLAVSLACKERRSLNENLISLDNKKYEKLNKYIKNKSVVGIGENTHGDGQLFELKTEIIEHLHKKMGFEAVLMESDFLATEQILPALSSHSLKEAANIGIQSTWADSKEYSLLLKYLKSTAKRGDTLYFHGFDSQMSGVESLNIHIAQAQLFKDKSQANEYDNLLKALKIIVTRNTNSISLDSLKLLKKTVSHLKRTRNRFSEQSYQWLRNIEGNLSQLILLKEAPPVTPKNYPKVLSHPNYVKSGSIRDSLMFYNVKYYLEKYNKVIIWGANNHLKNKSDKQIWMGDLLKKSLGDDYYSILVVNNKGKWSYPAGKPNGVIPRALKGTLVYEISNAINSEIAFLDIKTTELPRLRVRATNWITTDSINVSDYCDAILYVRNAVGSTMLDE